MWVVEPRGDKCAGPFDPDEVTDEILDALGCEKVRSHWIQRHRDRFEPQPYESRADPAAIRPS
jgi:hypothetical protein